MMRVSLRKSKVCSDTSDPATADLRLRRGGRMHVCLAGVVTALLLSVGQGATAQMAADWMSLPNYDIRLMDAPTRQAAQEEIAARDHAARTAAEAALEARIPQLSVAYDLSVDSTQYLGSTARLLTDKLVGRPWDAKQVVADFVCQNAALIGIAVDELTTPGLTTVIRDFHTQHNGVRHLTWQQQINGIDLFHARLRTSVSADGEIVNINSFMLQRPAGGFVVPEYRLTAEQAVAAAADHVGIRMTAALIVAHLAAGANDRQVFARTADFADAIEVYKVYFPLTPTQVRPAYMVTVPEIGIGNTYETIVDGADGRVLYRWNRLHFDSTEPITLRVYVHDSPAPGSPGNATPNQFQFPFEPRELITVMPADVTAFSPNGWIDDGDNTTAGNNTISRLDLGGNNEDDNEPPVTGSPYRVFDFPLDTTQAPSTYRDAAMSQMFYLVNRYHDRLYAVGFDEAAGNFQVDNFGRGGSGGDRVRADVQDGGGINNANYNTGGNDGTGARVQMYIWSGPTPDRDGDLDADIVYHECTHGVSIRLHEGAIFGGQSGGMGEGWGDFIGTLLSAEPGDDVNATYHTGGHSVLQLGQASFMDNYYFGIRRFPYSTDVNINPQTYADIDPNQQSYPPSIPKSPIIGNNAAEVHNVGETWCNTLLECRASFVGQYGFDGNEMLMQLVIDGMKLSPGQPNFLQARDSIVQADLLNNGGTNLALLWTAFAKRGMGYSATSPPGTTTSGVQEGYNTPPPLLYFFYPDGQPELANPDGSTGVTIDVLGALGGVSVAESGLLHYSINDGPFATSPLVQLAANQFQALLPAAECGSSLRWYVTMQEASGGLFTDPPTGAAGAYSAITATDIVVLFSDDFETDQGWTVGAPGDNATTGVWTRVDPNGTLAQPEDDYSEDGVACFVTGQGTAGGDQGQADIDGGTTTLISPTFAVPAGPTAIRYARWYSNNTGATPNTDTFVISISNNDGASWTTAETVGPEVDAGGGWKLHTFFVSDVIAPTVTMKMRFVAADLAPGSVVEAAIDEFEVIRYECNTTTPVTIASANPPLDNPFVAGTQAFRDVLDAGNTAAVTDGIGGATTPNENTTTYNPISVNFSSAPTPTPAPGNVTVACTGSPPAVCPTVTAVSGSGAGPYLVTLSGVIPPGECTTLTFAGLAAGQKVQYQSLPGDVSYDGTVGTTDVLSLVVAQNNGTAAQPANLPRYDIDRSGSVSAIDVLRLIQVLNGVNSLPFFGATVTPCP